MVDDKKNWNSLCSGSMNGLEVLFKRYYDDLFNYGLKISMDSNLVDDVIQDLFVYLWEKHESLSNVEKVKSYLFIAFKRRLIKSLAMSQCICDEEVVEKYGFSLSMEDMLMDEEHDNEKMMHIKKALLTLGDKQKEAIFLKFHVGLSIAEMADQLDMNSQSVKNLLHRAYKKMRHVVSKDLILFFINLIYFGKTKSKTPT
ncbi:sigma-70 family RNA polymerase sigma factor [Halosquirtibacter laminarini]|uniref:Sigma-70 family RNA polymerase sigma factor n=1 Tax=Halosquirtibacter laminarini TaxID=3374600 RepID=A0AC61NGN9_9BACT|nr:sigma-70 family RNA polymerase sigma factor [Prolixibacteraceae bacterium]